MVWEKRKCISPLATPRGPLRQYDVAEQNYGEAIRIRHQLKDVAGEGECYKAIAELHADAGNADTAKLNFGLARKCYQTASQPQGEFDVLKSMGEMFIRRRDFDLAEAVLTDALQLMIKIAPYSREIAGLYERIAFVQEARGLLEKALPNYQKARDIFRMLQLNAQGDALQRKIAMLGGQ
jgi:tetratricopeptide (TPR) repeat protein